MKRLIFSFLVFLLVIPHSAFAATLSAGDLMVVNVSYSVPLYASYVPYDYTVIAFVPAGSVVMYISAVDRGFCVAYDNFVGYMDEYALQKVSGNQYDFAIPDGDAYFGVTGGHSFAVPPAYSHGVHVPAFPYTPVPIRTNQNISTRTGPGTNYTEPGTFSRYIDYTVYYQIKGGSVYWGYVEFSVNNEKIRAYTGVKRFTPNGYMPCSDEAWVYADIVSSCPTRYGPGYSYMEAPYKSPAAGTRVKAYYTERNWTMIEYSLADGRLHRGWVPDYTIG